MPFDALVLREPRGLRAAQYGTRAQLAATTGDVEGYLTLAGCDRRVGTASYALRIVNQSADPLRARMTCATLQGHNILAYPLDVHIAPFSTCETLLPVRLTEVGPYDRAIVTVEGGAIAFSLEAPAPAGTGRSFPWMAAILATLVLGVSAALVAGAATPRIGLLATPARSLAGNRLDIPYSFGGWASMWYALKTSDGKQLYAGLTGSHQGTLHFAIPPSAGTQLIFTAQVAGPLGSLSRVSRIAIAQAAPTAAALAVAPLPRIGAFAIITPNVHAGDPLKVAYITNAREGSVWLIDESGQLWARAPINSDGVTALDVPRSAAGREMRVVLHARIGSADAVASAHVTVLPGVVLPPLAAQAQSGVALALSSSTVLPGEEITVTLNGAHSDALVTMTDTNGNQIEQGAIPSGQDAVTLTAPSSTGAAATYYITANVTEGVSEQTLVRTLTVAR